MPTGRTSLKQLARRWALGSLRALLTAALLFLGTAALVVLVILRRQGDIPPMGEQLARIGAMAGGVLALLALWWIPRRQALAVAGELSPRARAELVERVAGVHVLEGLARNSDELRRPVYEALAVFVRERGRSDSARASLQPSPDVLAAVAVVARRTADGGASPLRPDFSGANLGGIVAPDA